jgi:site-specific DNA-adenine methylase
MPSVVPQVEHAVRSTYVRSPTIPYPGAKGRMAPTLVSFMPREGRSYVEPFVGRGNVFWAAALNLDFQSWGINDIATAPFFKALRKSGAKIRVPQRTREEFVRQRCRFRSGDSRAILLEPYLTFSGGGYEKGGFGGARSATADNFEITLRRCTEILQKTSAKVTNVDWTDLNLDELGSDDFVFFDPPYYGADVRAYSSTRFDYEGFVSALSRAKYRWLLTEYRQPFYVQKLGAPFFEREMQLACDRIGTRSRVECCWKNY